MAITDLLAKCVQLSRLARGGLSPAANGAMQLCEQKPQCHFQAKRLLAPGRPCSWLSDQQCSGGAAPPAGVPGGAMGAAAPADCRGQTTSVSTPAAGIGHGDSGATTTAQARMS